MGTYEPSLIAVGLALYFLPALAAGLKRHRKALAIFALDLFLGWTLVGWVAALIWAFKRPPAPPAQIVVNFGMSEAPPSAAPEASAPAPASPLKGLLVIGAVAAIILAAVFADWTCRRPKAAIDEHPAIPVAATPAPQPAENQAAMPPPTPEPAAPVAAPAPAPAPAQTPVPAPAASAAPAAKPAPAPTSSRPHKPRILHKARKPYDPYVDPLPDASGRY